MASKSLSLIQPQQLVRDKVSEAILALVVKVPTSREAPASAGALAQTRSRAIARNASRKASLLASSMALPPGIFGWLTFLPEIVGVWKIQAQMVADIAAVHDQSATLRREQMLYCLFKHVSAQLVRDVVVRAGERFLVQKASGAMLQSIAQKLGVKVTQGLVGKGVSRFVPILGAVGVGAYAYFDTTRVGQTAVELFTQGVVVVDEAPPPAPEPRPHTKPKAQSAAKTVKVKVASRTRAGT